MSNHDRKHLVFMDGFMTARRHPITDVKPDPRRLENGMVIHAENHYVDEPFGTIAADGAWVHGITIADGQEADPTQITIVRRSEDKGLTWSEPVPIEPSGSPEFARAVLVTTPNRRIYIFYTYNTTGLTEVAGDEPPYKDGICWRVDAIGDFVYKCSDDDGRTWSNEHTVIPVRAFELDKANPYKGDIRFFWNVGIPFIDEGAVYVPLTKVGAFGEFLYSSSEGVLLKSGNLLSENDTTKHHWETLPDGEIGLRAPHGGKIAEEHSFVPLSDGSFYCCYRTVEGHPACSYSRDKGHVWSEPGYKKYLDGRSIKHSRAANFTWRLSGNRYLYWYHNHGGKFLHEGMKNDSHYSFENRNPVWLTAGTEVDTPEGKVLHWAEPEIIIYADDTMFRMSYPHLFEDDGKVYVAETNKDIARIHEIDDGLLEDLFNQTNLKAVAREGVVLECKESRNTHGSHDMPHLPHFCRFDHTHADYRSLNLRQGVTLEFTVEFADLSAGQILFDNRKHSGEGFVVRTTPNGTIEIVMSDIQSRCSWECDEGVLLHGGRHHIGVIVDGGPRLITFVVDGKLCDGGDFRQFGWGHFAADLRSINGAETLRVGESCKGKILAFRLYDRYLRTSEMIGNWRSGELASTL